jgi:hypothetical protein
MIFWSFYRRHVRVPGRCLQILVRRARCRACSVTHALVPSFVLLQRLDVTETIGEVIEQVLDRRSGVRPAAARLEVPHTTARGWLRRFVARARALAVSFAALSVELGAEPTAPLSDSTRDALCAVRSAFEAASSLPGWQLVGLWRFASAVSGGCLLSANTSSPYLVIGRRRFMPPVPLPDDKEDRSDGT